MISAVIVLVIVCVVSLAVYAATVNSVPGETTEASAEDQVATKMLKGLYAIFLALLITLFVTSGITAFYPAPKPPETCFT